MSDTRKTEPSAQPTEKVKLLKDGHLLAGKSYTQGDLIDVTPRLMAFLQKRVLIAGPTTPATQEGK